MALRDRLAGEDADSKTAASAAAQGRSITGLSGRHAEMNDRFATGGEMFGERVAPPPTNTTAPLPERSKPVAPPGERKPFGDREQTLSYPTREGYRPYWFNDRAGRIARAKQAGYSHVLDSDTGEPVSRVTDVIDGRGRSSYLMEIPIEWYQSDMAKNARRLQEMLDDIKTGRAGPGSDDNRYVPQQGITIQGR